MTPTWEALPLAPSLLGESPFWHPDEASLYWCDIPGKALRRWHAASGKHQLWDFDTEPACCVPLPGGLLLLAMRDGLFRFDPATGQRQALAPPPYDPATERFNDGKADAQGRFWVGTIYEPRTPPKAALYRLAGRGALDRMAGGITVSNGLAFSPDGRTLYWADTKAHRVFAFDWTVPTAACRASACSWPSSRRATPGQPLPPTAAAPTARRWTPKAPTGWPCSRASACCAWPRRPVLRVAAAGALPHHALLWRCRPAHAVHHHRRATTARRRTGGPAPGRLRAAPAGGRAGLPVNFARP
jgi:hypothetical protein